MAFYKGDIVMPKQRTQDATKLRHPAIVWDSEVAATDDFTGIMLSKSGSGKYPDNVPMRAEHFVPESFFTRTHFVNQRFIKFAHWGPFEKVGCLSEEGLVFIEDRLTDKNPLPFDHYYTQ